MNIQQLPAIIKRNIPNAKLPVQYAEAVRALQACMTLNEAREWNRKAEALAAWARVYKDTTVKAAAARLKLHAHRRMSELADELAPRHHNGVRQTVRYLKKELGIGNTAAQAIRHTGLLPKKQFDEIIARPMPPSPSALRDAQRAEKFSEAYNILMLRCCGGVLLDMRSLCRKRTVASMTRGMPSSEAVELLPCVREVTAWLDELEQRLTQKAKK